MKLNLFLNRLWCAAHIADQDAQNHSSYGVLDKSESLIICTCCAVLNIFIPYEAECSCDYFSFQDVLSSWLCFITKVCLIFASAVSIQLLNLKLKKQ